MHLHRRIISPAKALSFAALIAITGCTPTPSNTALSPSSTSSPDTRQIDTFTVDSPAALNTVTATLESAGVDPTTISTFRSWAEAYQGSANDADRLVNCRMLSFLLAGSSIHIARPEGAHTEGLFMDHEQLDRAPSLFTGEQRARYDTLYGRIPTPSLTTPAELARAISDYHEHHGVAFSQGGILPIDVYLHDTLDPQAFLFIGHTGVALPAQGKYLFLEKLSFEDPFQATWFDTPEQIALELHKRYDDSAATGGNPPLVSINGELPST